MLAGPAAAAFVALVLALGACGSPGHPAAGPSGHTPAASGQARLEAVVLCLRAHGVTDFPDPVYDPGTGQWTYGDYRRDIPQAAEQACEHLDPSAVSPSPPVPQAQFQALLQLARCIRQHGVPAWPDPDPQGQFPLPPPLLTKMPSPAQQNALKACQRYVPSGGIHAVSAP
jgi:hypothetical protein